MICKECNQQMEDKLFFSRHIRVHDITLEEYTLKWKYNNHIPKCKCGCDKLCRWNVSSRDFNIFFHGHHAHGRKKSDEEKKKIGLKNSINMKTYFAKNPDKKEAHIKNLRAGVTPESENRRISSTKKAYSLMSESDKQKFVIHAKNLWVDQREKMFDGARKGGAKFKKRYANNEFDFVERNKKLSIAISKKYVEGGFCWSSGEYIPMKCSNRSICAYRSSWELEFMKLLDGHRLIKSWEYEPFFLRYTFENVNRRYIPDFVITTIHNEKYMIEVKPISLQCTGKTDEKRKAAVNFCEQHQIEKFLFWSLGDSLDEHII
jgi:hypothetical protein